MRLDFAPMEGITNYLYRRAHHDLFGGADRYYTPFISPNSNFAFMTKEQDEIAPEHNKGINVIPQLLTCSAEHFLWAARELAEMGYSEVNLNLGCPSGTVTAKKKGSGFLYYPDELDRFFDDVFSKAPIAVSVKTRIGRNAPEEFEKLLPIFNRYPITELIVHPRIRSDFYRMPVRPEWFEYAAEHCTVPLSYNGDLFTQEQIRAQAEKYPQLKAIMLGRGMLSNPALMNEYRGTGARSKAALRRFHDVLYQYSKDRFSGSVSILSHMKELWAYQYCMFDNSEKYAKAIRKAKRFDEYDSAVSRLFDETELKPGASFRLML